MCDCPSQLTWPRSAENKLVCLLALLSTFILKYQAMRFHRSPV
jgi:hypothetical protein